MKDINPKKAFNRRGQPKKGYRHSEETSGKIPDPMTVPVKSKKPKLKPMRTVSSGTNAYGSPTRTVRNKTRRSL